MKYRIISVGKIQEPFYIMGINEYLKRLGPYTRIELVQGLEEKTSPRAGPKEIERILAKEGERIIRLLGKDSILVLMDAQGIQLSSEDFAQKIREWDQGPKSRIDILVGASYGFSAAVRKRADLMISFSRMTFPHQMAVLILMEQIYRGYKILKGEPYHK
ncbi:MAG: 23S rRNA (pseudouridine(1915)-N(3))-methyltransferase RlmH [Syntrophomonadaceae bacterium]|nr:23S rRNA (pseudouridine(1915)-N(3))-methyltransferase RlmH [Syntrophomonadaceae bacterium]